MNNETVALAILAVNSKSQTHFRFIVVQGVAGQMATMREVAERARVSESTVSHVLNKTRAVSEDKRERVQAAIRELGFAANAHARGLARGRSDLLGIVVSDIENPFFPGMIKSFESSARGRGFDVLLFSTNYDADIAERACRKLIENKVSAVAIMTSQIELPLIESLTSSGIAVVMLDGPKVSRLCGSLRFSYEKGAVEGVRYLYNLGHRSIAMIAGPQNRRSHVAYLAAVEAAGGALSCRIMVMEGRNTAESGAEAVGKMLSGTELPTAVMCSNDLTAIGAIQALNQAGLRVPDQMSVIGADDIPMASLMLPPLTTVHMPRQELGKIAFETLYGMLEDKRPGTEIRVDTRLILRASTGAPSPR